MTSAEVNMILNVLTEFRQESNQHYKELRNEINYLRLEMADQKSDLEQEIQDVRTELKQEIQDVRTELHQQSTRIDALIGVTAAIQSDVKILRMRMDAHEAYHRKLSLG